MTVDLPPPADTNEAAASAVIAANRHVQYADMLESDPGWNHLFLPMLKAQRDDMLAKAIRGETNAEREQCRCSYIALDDLLTIFERRCLENLCIVAKAGGKLRPEQMAKIEANRANGTTSGSTAPAMAATLPDMSMDGMFSQLMTQLTGQLPPPPNTNSTSP